LHIRLVPVELVLGDPYGLIEIVIGESRVENLVAVLCQVDRLDAFSRIKAVEEENFHGGSLG
jgi:hypothetical protein